MPQERLELSCLSTLASKTSVSTNSTTRALNTCRGAHGVGHVYCSANEYCTAVACLHQVLIIWCRLSESNTLYLTKPDYKSGAIPLCTSRHFLLMIKYNRIFFRCQLSLGNLFLSFKPIFTEFIFNILCFIFVCSSQK